MAPQTPHKLYHNSSRGWWRKGSGEQKKTRKGANPDKYNVKNGLVSRYKHRRYFNDDAIGRKFRAEIFPKFSEASLVFDTTTKSFLKCFLS